MHKTLTAHLLLLSFIVLLGPLAWAARSATVSIDGAMVYKDASFDAPVIAYLKKNKRIRVSNKTYGPFYKVKLRKGVIGYISDIDIKIASGEGDSRRPPRRNDQRKNDRDDDDSPGDIYRDDEGPEESDKDSKAIFATRYIGITGGIVNFQEEIFDPVQKGKANIMVFGAKVTGPDLFFKGAYILDINLNVGLSAPSYYDDISTTAPSGMLLLLDANVLFPVMTGYDQNWMVYLGGGPLLVYSKFNITVTLADNPDEETALDLQEIKFGGSLVGGYGHQFRDFAVKVEGKFHIEKSSYFGFTGSIQKKF